MDHKTIKGRIKAIDWSSFNIAGGAAKSVPEHLMQLLSDDIDEAKKAIFQLDWGLCHQHISISSTALPALPFLLEMIGHTKENISIEILDLISGLSDCIKHIPDYTDPTPDYVFEIQKILISKIPRFERLSKHKNKDIAFYSSEIIKDLTQSKDTAR
ncbi:hypothetical protein [Xenorhabdus sp. KK7.4]|uniref:hypothetical protein n=1 Tax=Xenorhabdus sp. KK7.4 TaxID=1851572 RepID=UPI000C048896|nr:hypothetical protein [Xenorhabdus sp. KK7.4]PHM52472.1 hypothetical protein Xekk_03149 [Xenorhabdus sp. KK7.4]